jgi:branched-chain amino acid aminotransferase
MADVKETKVFINGTFVPESEATISVRDRSFLYGDGVFEGIAVFEGKIMFLREHVERLYASCRQVYIEMPVPPAQMETWILETARVNELFDHAYLRPLVSRGEGALGLDQTAAIRKPNIVIIPQAGRAIEYGGPMKSYSAVMAAVRRVPAECLDSRIKGNNYLNNILAQLEATRQGVGLAIMLDTHGFLSECPGHNLFVVRQGRLLTPRAHNVLNGITRQMVLELAPSAGVAAAEADLTAYDLGTADEVFVTNSLSGVAAVTEIGGWTVADGKPGPISQRLRDVYVRHALQRGTSVR